MARTEDEVEQQLQWYSDLRQQVAAFDSGLQTEAEVQDETIIRDLISKAATLFVFDFEGAVALRL